MPRTTHFLAAACLGLLGACSVTIPQGKYVCDQDSDCPAKWVCFESACYSQRPSGSMDGGSDRDAAGNGGGGIDSGGRTDGGGTTGGGSTTGDAGNMSFDGGVVTSGCDAFTTFYRDSDGDGLGAASMSISACSVETGYVTNRDDCNDMCSACTTPSASEVCDGFDNECDGTVDNGQLLFSTRVAYDKLSAGEWAELVPTADGGVLFTVVSSSSGTAIRGQRVAPDGKALGDPVAIEGAAPNTLLANFAADHLNGKIVLTWFESDGIKATVVKASDLSTLVAEKLIKSAANLKFPTLDVAVSASASGGRALFAYSENSDIKTLPMKLVDLSVESAENVIYTAANPSQSFPMVTLAAAPCLSGFYAAVQDEFLPVMRVVGLGATGIAAGTPYDAPIGANLVFSALPALRVEGGDCDHAPTRLTLAYAIDETLAVSAGTDVHFAYLNIARANDLDTITLGDGLNYTQTGWVLPAGRVYPSGVVYVNRALDILAYDGRYLLTTVTASSTSDKGVLEVREIKGTTVVGTHEASDIKPAVPLNQQLALLGKYAWLGTASWSNKDPAGLLRIGCGD